MNGAPRVSVLLPAWNAAATLPDALRSLRRQTLQDWECVLVDDGSTDTTRSIAEACAREDVRVRVFTTGHDGVVAAMNTGLAECRAPLVAVMNADDLMHKARLAEQCEHLDARSEVAAVGSHVRIFPYRPMQEGMRRYERWINGIDGAEAVRREAFVECPVAQPTLMLRTDVLRDAGGWRDRGWPEDYDLVLRLLAAGEVVDVLPRRLLAWRDAPAGLTRTGAAYRQERFVACKAQFLAEGFLAGGDEYLLWGYGGTGKALRRALAEHGLRPAAVIELHPGRLGQRIHGAPVIDPGSLHAWPRGRLVVSVAGESARAEIQACLAELGWQVCVDYLFAA